MQFSKLNVACLLTAMLSLAANAAPPSSSSPVAVEDVIAAAKIVAPVAEAEAGEGELIELEGRQSDAIAFIYEEADFGGKSYYISEPSKQCWRLNGEARHFVSSIKVMEGYECKWYRDWRCNASVGGELKTTGYYAENVNYLWDDQIWTFMCYKV